MRSLLFVPGNSRKLLDHASKTSADIVLPDIEDSVSSDESKESARRLVAEYVEDRRFLGKPIFPRINSRDSGHLLKDLSCLTLDGVSGFVYPKSSSAEDIFFFDRLLETFEWEKKIQVGHFKIIPLIETPGAVVRVDEICKASDRVIAIAFGCEDFIAELEGQRDPEDQSIFVPRALIAMAARANGIVPIDTVHVKVHEFEDLKRSLSLAKKLGFEGMLALNPKEISYIHEVFTPSKSELEAAREMIRLSEAIGEKGMGVALQDQQFVGPPFVRGARRILSRASKYLDSDA